MSDLHTSQSASDDNEDMTTTTTATINLDVHTLKLIAELTTDMAIKDFSASEASAVLTLLAEMTRKDIRSAAHLCIPELEAIARNGD